MNRWQKCLLGDVISLKRGYDLPKINRVDGPYPIVSSSGVSGFHKTSKVRGPGVVTGRYGTLGEIFYISQNFWPLNTSLYVKDFKGNNPRFISYFLRTLNFEDQNGAGAVPGVNRNALHMIQVRKPFVTVQKKIAAVLSAYDDLIENNNRRIALLEKMAEEIYREWFVRLRFPGHEGVAIADSDQKKSGKTLNEVCEFIVDCEHKTAPIQDTGHPSIRTPNIGEGRLLLDNVNRVSEQTYKIWTNRAIPASGDLVLAREAPVGNVAIIPRRLSICLGQRTILIRPNKDEIKPYYLLFLLLSEEIRHNLLGLSTGATVRHLNMRDIRNLNLPHLPAIRIQQKFEDVISKQYDLISTLDERTQNLKTTRDRLLTRLISGKLSIEDLDIRFPPSMIKAADSEAAG